MTSNNSNELSNKIVQLRGLRGYTQQYVAEYLGIDKSTYAHYEAARRTPNVDKLRRLAELYGLNDELLGSSFPIEVSIEYPKEELDYLEKVIRKCKQHSESYERNHIEYKKLQEALQPILKVRDEALDLPNINVQKIESGTTVKKAYLDIRAEKLINECIRKQAEVMGW